MTDDANPRWISRRIFFGVRKKILTSASVVERWISGDGLLARFVPIVLILALAIVAWRNLLSPSAIVGVHWDWGLPFYKFQMMHIASTAFDIYSYPMGNLAKASFGAYFNIVFFGAGAVSPLSVAAYEDTLLVFFTFVSGAASYLLVSHFGWSRYFSFVASIVYMFSPWIFSEVVEGHLTILAAYSFFPLSIYLILRMKAGGRLLSYEVLLSVILLDLLQSGGYFPILYFGTAVLIVADGAARGSPFTRGLIKKLFVLTCLFFATDAYLMFQLLEIAFQPSQTLVLGGNYALIQTHPAANYFFLDYPGNKSFLSSITQFESVWYASAVSLLIIAISATITRRMRFETRFASLLMIAGYGLPLIFTIPWFSNVLYPSVPILTFFHDTWNYLILVVLGESILLGVSLGTIAKKNERSAIRMAGLLVLSITLVAVYSAPFYSGNFNGNVTTYNVPKSYAAAEQMLDNASYTNAWLPLFLAQDSSGYFAGGTAYNPMQTYASNTFDLFVQPLPYYINSLLASGNITGVSPLLGLYSVKDVVAPTDMWVPQLTPIDGESTRNYSSLLLSSLDFQPVFTSKEVWVFQNHFALPVAFGQSAQVTFVGSLAELDEFEQAYSLAFGHPLMVAFPFMTGAEMTRSLLRGSDYIITGADSEQYLISELIPSGFVYFPWSQAKTVSGNWFSQASYPYVPPSLASSPYPFFASTVPSTFATPLHATAEGNYSVMVYAYSSPNSSNLDVTVGQGSFIIDTNSTIAGWSWHTMTGLHVAGSSSEMTVTSAGGLNAVAVIDVVPNDILQDTEAELVTLMNASHVVPSSNANASEELAVASIEVKPLHVDKAGVNDFIITDPTDSKVLYLATSTGPNWSAQQEETRLRETNGIGFVNGWFANPTANGDFIRLHLEFQDDYNLLALLSAATFFASLVVSGILLLRRSGSYMRHLRIG